nr:MAG TPA: hypothetical protein [Caudoviricetes sp.]
MQHSQLVSGSSGELEKKIPVRSSLLMLQRWAL